MSSISESPGEGESSSAAPACVPGAAPKIDKPDDDVVLRVRFATGLADLLHPLSGDLTAGTLKDVIRDRRAAETKGRILRLIYLGKILADDVRLVDVCRIPPPPPRTSQGARGRGVVNRADAGGKGKAKVLERPAGEVVLQCSIGSLISDLAREAEQRRVALGGAATSTGAVAASASAGTASAGLSSVEDSRSTTPAPRGFDRLRQAGFDEADIAALRQQFFRGTNTPVVDSTASANAATGSGPTGTVDAATYIGGGVPAGVAGRFPAHADTNTASYSSYAVGSDQIDVVDWTALYDVELLADQPDPERDRELQLEAEERWMEEEAGPGGAAPHFSGAANDGRTDERESAGEDDRQGLLSEMSGAAGSHRPRGATTRMHRPAAPRAAGAGLYSFGEEYTQIIIGLATGYFVGFLGIFFSTEANAAPAASAVSTPAGQLLGAAGVIPVGAARARYNGWHGSLLTDNKFKICLWAGLILNILFGFCRE